jgi:hypothetical protein
MTRSGEILECLFGLVMAGLHGGPCLWGCLVSRAASDEPPITQSGVQGLTSNLSPLHANSRTSWALCCKEPMTPVNRCGSTTMAT